MRRLRVLPALLLLATAPLAAPPPSHAVEWTLDLSSAAIPSEPVSGRLAGKAFAVEAASLQGSVLTLRQGAGFFADREVMIFTFLDGKQTLEGKRFLATPTSEGAPHLHVKWIPEGGEVPEVAFHVSGYAMRLEFGARVGNQMPGAIYLCLPDEQKSALAGTFTAQLSGDPARGGAPRGLDEFVPPELDLNLAGDLPRSGGGLAQGLALGLLGLAGALLSFAGWIWFLVVAFRRHVGWGLAVLLVPPAALVFFFMNIERSLRPFLLSLLGSLLLLGAAWGLALTGLQHLPELPALLAGEPHTKRPSPAPSPTTNQLPNEPAASLFVKVDGPIVVGDPAELVVENFGPPRGRLRVGPREVLSYGRTDYVIENGRVANIISK